MSLLDAATNDLAQLINRLDLQATPDMSPMSGRSPSLFTSSQAGSPTKRMTLESPAVTVSHLSSLRYALIL
jgi:serine/arginine repetitive matrix protein 2